MSNENEENYDKAFGKIFQQFRNAKGLTQEEAAEGIITPKQLSRFERGNTMPSFDNVYSLLKNINVTLFEFSDAYNRFSENRDVLLYTTDIATAFLNQDIKKLKKMLVEIEKQIELFPHLKKYKIDKWHIEVTISVLDPDYELPNSSRGSLRMYFLKLKAWSLYDIQLLGHCLFVFKKEGELAEVVENMIISTQKAANLHLIEREVIRTTLNAVHICISKNKLDAAENFVHYLKNWDIHEYFMYEKFSLKYLEAWLDYQLGKDSALKTMKKCQEALLFLDCTAIADMIEKEIEEIVKNKRK